MEKITTCIWLDDQAEAAAKFYSEVFKDSKIINTSRYDGVGQDVTGGKAGAVMTVELELEGRKFTLLNGGPIFKPNEAVSFMVACKDQAEIDYYWEKLSAVPESEQCGWLKDKFGVSWQILPANMGELMSAGGSEATAAMLKMHKIVVAELEATAK